jgi:hypothetical protein
MSTDQFKASNPFPDPNPNPNTNLNLNPNPHPHPHRHPHPSPSPSPSPSPTPTPTPTPTKASKRYHEFFLQAFLSPRFFGSSGFAGLGFSEINPKEKEINSLTQTVFYSTELMSRQARHVPTRSRCLVITPMVFYSTELMSRQARHVPTRSRCLVITPMVFYSFYRAHERQSQRGMADGVWVTTAILTMAIPTMAGVAAGVRVREEVPLPLPLPLPLSPKPYPCP